MRSPHPKKLIILIGLALALVGKISLPAAAQAPAPPPSPTEPALPPIEPIEPETLPEPQDVPLEALPLEPETDLLEISGCLPLADSGEQSFEAIAIEVTGSTVLQAEIAEKVACYEGKIITLSDLFVLRSQITQLYLENGYVTSGAFIPSGQFVDGQLASTGHRRHARRHSGQWASAAERQLCSR